MMEIYERSNDSERTIFEVEVGHDQSLVTNRFFAKVLSKTLVPSGTQSLIISKSLRSCSFVTTARDSI